MEKYGTRKIQIKSVQVIKNSNVVMVIYDVNNKKTFMALDNSLSQLNDTVDISKMFFAQKYEQENAHHLLQNLDYIMIQNIRINLLDLHFQKSSLTI